MGFYLTHGVRAGCRGCDVTFSGTFVGAILEKDLKWASGREEANLEQTRLLTSTTGFPNAAEGKPLLHGKLLE